jgi:4-hydroxy-3-polyprenylbenzoate decarboxylase
LQDFAEMIANLHNLRDFLALLDSQGELRRIAAEVDPHLEIAAIADRVVKRLDGGPALFFSAVRGHNVPVVTNLFGSGRRMAWALGTENLDELAGRLASDLQQSAAGNGAERLRLLMDAPHWQSQLQTSASCQEVIASTPSFSLLPALQAWPGDAGRFLTLPLVFTRDAESGAGNCGMYRMQIFDERTAGLHWGADSDAARHAGSWAARGERMPVAVALGGPPALIYAAAAPLPKEVAETAFAGYLQGAPLAMVACRTCDLQVPADAEFVLEGYVEPGETRLEGPFGNHTGFYAPPAPAPVFHLTCLTHRRQPIYPCTVVGPPPRENLQLAQATARLFLPLLQIDFPEILGWQFLPQGAFHGCSILSVRPECAGQGLALIRRLWATDLFRRARLLVTVDADLDPGDGSTLLWRLLNQAEPGRDLLIAGNRLGIDATEKTGRPRVTADPTVFRRVSERWSEYGID